jgi:hypothetical protein
MKPLDHSLQRLLRAAARAPSKPEIPEHPSFALETAVLRRRRSAAVEDEWPALVPLFRRAVICSGLIMVLCAAWSWFQTRTPDAGASDLAAYAMTIQIPP